MNRYRLLLTMVLAMLLVASTSAFAVTQFSADIVRRKVFCDKM